MHQAIVFNTDIDKRAEVHDVSDRSGHLHVDFQILKLLDIAAEHDWRRVLTRVARRFFHFLNDVGQRQRTDAQIACHSGNALCQRLRRISLFDLFFHILIAAVLDHSASVGVRGQITYDYLKGLGFSQIDVIGCPSLALNGPGLPLREKQPLTPESKLCFTGSVSNPPDFKKFAVRCTERFPNTYFVPQFIDDLRLMYLGIPHPDTADSRVLHPTNLDHPVFVEDKARFFINLPSMFAFNREMDFNYGTRIHGAIGNILCGVPSLLFPTDARIRELAEYHNIPAIPASAVTPDTDLAALYDQTDFRQVNNGHAERFWHLIDFLNENGIKTIYDDRTGTPARSLYDEKTAATSYAQPVHSMLVRPPEEIARRVDTAVRLQRKEIEDDSRLATQLRDSQRKVTQLQERNKKQAAQIQALKDERKALKTELKATKKPLRRLAWYQRTSTFGIGLARLKKKLRRLLGKEK